MGLVDFGSDKLPLYGNQSKMLSSAITLASYQLSGVPGATKTELESPEILMMEKPICCNQSCLSV